MRQMLIFTAVIFFLASCGNIGTLLGRNAEVVFVEAGDYERADILPPVELSPAQNLIGRWYWYGLLYYEFHPDGTGTRNTGETMQKIRWDIANGEMLFVCTSPDYCADYCHAPSQWYFHLQGNNLTLAHAFYPNEIFFTYKRR